jgi:type 1 glutamine amidotransferase
VLFYFMPIDGPAEDGPTKAALEHVGETVQGIFVLHHAILAYPEWPVWNAVVGIEDRRFGFHEDQRMQVEVANPEHPIMRGLTGWEMTDETYTMDNAGPGSEILLTVDHPHSMRTIAWTRQHESARVFCLELGHDNSAWSEPNFRTVVERGIQWVARRI